MRVSPISTCINPFLLENAIRMVAKKKILQQPNKTPATIYSTEYMLPNTKMNRRDMAKIMPIIMLFIKKAGETYTLLIINLLFGKTLCNPIDTRRQNTCIAANNHISQTWYNY